MFGAQLHIGPLPTERGSSEGEMNVWFSRF